MGIAEVVEPGSWSTAGTWLDLGTTSECMQPLTLLHILQICCSSVAAKGFKAWFYFIAVARLVSGECLNN